METPGWYRQFSSEHHGVCSFGEMRCTDQLMMDLFAVSALEPLPVCIVASESPAATQYWRSKGLDLFSLGLVADSPQAFCSGHMDPKAMCALIKQALTLPGSSPRAAGLRDKPAAAAWCAKAH